MGKQQFLHVGRGKGGGETCKRVEVSPSIVICQHVMSKNEKILKSSIYIIFQKMEENSKKTQRWLPGEQDLGERIGWSSMHLFLLWVLLLAKKNFFNLYRLLV